MPYTSYTTYCTSPLQYHFSRRAAIVEKREHMFLRAMSKAMRYYRVWIYSCNVALFLGTFIYFVAFITVIGDSRLNFFPAIRLYQPTFIYSYCAIIVQGGLLQTIGCIGALKLNERYLNLYLLTIFVLLFGDGILGIAWILRYNSIVTSLRSDLKLQIAKEYAINPRMRDLWDDLQLNSKCCGVDGPADYNTSSWLNKSDIQPPQPTMLGHVHLFVLPPSCCLPESLEPNKPNQCEAQLNDPNLFQRGCYDQIYHWLQHSVDLLSVLGFCVITFIKMCFLCLLRYEIKEMIEKIKVIKGQTAASNCNASMMLPFQDLEAYLPRPSMQQDTLNAASSTIGLTGATGSQVPLRTNAITEKCHCRVGMSMGTNLTSTLSGSRMILSTSSANLSGCQSKKHSLV